MKRVAVIQSNYILNVVLLNTNDPLESNQMLEADALAAGYTYIPQPIQPNRKIWSTVSEFWNEFTILEKSGIIESPSTQIKLLNTELAMWRGDVWSDDERVQMGLDALVSAGIISESRKNEIVN